MTPDLSRRLALAVDVGNATPEQRGAIANAAQRARTFDELPPEIQSLVEDLES